MNSKIKVHKLSQCYDLDHELDVLTRVNPKYHCSIFSSLKIKSTSILIIFFL